MTQQGQERTRRRLSSSARRAVLTAHIVCSVGLLGEVAAFLTIAARATASDDTEFASAAYDLLSTFQIVFGIPLSFAALLTGLTLGLGSKWRVFRYPWVTIKLWLIVSVILVGALVLGPSVDQIRDDIGNDGLGTRILIGAIWDVVALAVATGLSVYKPGRAYALPLKRGA
jgi:hypothetical protein